MKIRKGESRDSAPKFRCSSRIVEDKGAWWFATRDMTFEGPFGSRLVAEKALTDYTRIMSSAFALSAELSLMDEAVQPAVRTGDIRATHYW